MIAESNKRCRISLLADTAESLLSEQEILDFVPPTDETPDLLNDHAYEGICAPKAKRAKHSSLTSILLKHGTASQSLLLKHCRDEQEEIGLHDRRSLRRSNSLEKECGADKNYENFLAKRMITKRLNSFTVDEENDEDDDGDELNLEKDFEKVLQDTLNKPMPTTRRLASFNANPDDEDDDDDDSVDLNLEKDFENVLQETINKPMPENIFNSFNEYELDVADEHNEKGKYNCGPSTTQDRRRQHQEQSIESIMNSSPLNKTKQDQEAKRKETDEEQEDNTENDGDATNSKESDKLRQLMIKSFESHKDLQDYDKKNGLPRNHCKTMIASSRTRRQLLEGNIITNSLLLIEYR